MTRVRSRIGLNCLATLFATMREQLQAAGLMREGFTFVDATHLIVKAPWWEERDNTRQQKLDPLNNEVRPKGAAVSQARMGCKGKKKDGDGDKEHASVAMQAGLINKVAIPPANVPDAQGLWQVWPTQGAIDGDKGSCTAPVRLGRVNTFERISD